MKFFKSLIIVLFLCPPVVAEDLPSVKSVGSGTVLVGVTSTHSVGGRVITCFSGGREKDLRFVTAPE